MATAPTRTRPGSRTAPKPKPGGKPKPGAKPAGKESFLKRKVGPLPVYGWIIAGVGVFLAYRFLSKSGSSSTAGTTPTDSLNTGAVPTGGTGGGGDSGAGGGSFTPADQQPYDPYGSFPLLFGGGSPTSDQAASQPGAALAPTSNAAGSTITLPPGYHPLEPLHPFATPASAPNFAASALAATQAAKFSGQAAPFGGVTSVRKLKNGATLTTYASGRQVEQAKGKTAFVARKGRPVKKR